RDLATARGLDIEIRPAISSVDTVLVDYPGTVGGAMTLLDAPQLARHRYQLDSGMTLVLFHLPELLRQLNDDLTMNLVYHLRGYYPDTHGCYVIISSVSPELPVRRTLTTLGELFELDALPAGATVVVPPVRRGGGQPR